VVCRSFLYHLGALFGATGEIWSPWLCLTSCGMPSNCLHGVNLVHVVGWNWLRHLWTNSCSSHSYPTPGLCILHIFSYMALHCNECFNGIIYMRPRYWKDIRSSFQERTTIFSATSPNAKIPPQATFCIYTVSPSPNAAVTSTVWPPQEIATDIGSSFLSRSKDLV
jgi:hypothetical protein